MKAAKLDTKANGKSSYTSDKTVSKTTGKKTNRALAKVNEALAKFLKITLWTMPLMLFGVVATTVVSYVAFDLVPGLFIYAANMLKISPADVALSGIIVWATTGLILTSAVSLVAYKVLLKLWRKLYKYCVSKMGMRQAH